MKTKRCSRCGQVKLLACFKHDAGRTDGYGAYCVLCNQLVAKEHYMVNRERRLQQSRDFRLRNPGYHRAYYHAHRERELARVKDIQYRGSHIVVPGEPLVVLPCRDMSRGQGNKR